MPSCTHRGCELDSPQHSCLHVPLGTSSLEMSTPPPTRPLMEDQVYILKHLPTQALFQTTYPVKTVRATLSGVVRTAASPNKLADLTGHGWEGNDSPCGSHLFPLMAKPFIPHGLNHPPSPPACWSPFLLGW